MAFNFPSSPIEGQEFTPPLSGVTYVYYNPRWLVKPDPATDPLKADITYVDAADAALQTDVDAKVDKAGDTMTGDLAIDKVSPRLMMSKTASGESTAVFGSMGGVARWSMFLGSSTPEGGANSGSNFIINRHNDAGTVLDNALNITRSSGLATFNGAVTVGGAVNTFNNFISTAFYPSLILKKSAGGASTILGSISGGTFRWEMQLGDEAAESTGNAGSNFKLNNYSDGGIQIATPIEINRATSVVNFAAAPTLPVANPTTSQQAAHKQYVDQAIATAIAGLFPTELRFTRTSSQHMTRLYGTTSSAAWTLSMWVKRVGLATRQALFGVESTSGAGKLHLEYDASNQLSLYGGAAGDTAIAVGPAYTSTTLWYHIVWSVPAGAPSSPRFHTLYVNNGSAMTGIISGNGINNAETHYIGQPSGYPDVLMKDVVFVDGSQLPPTDFGGDVGGVWTPKVYGGPFGANGFKLNFANRFTPASTNLGRDVSGNDNHWTAVNF